MMEEVTDSGVPGKIHYLTRHPVVRSDKAIKKQPKFVQCLMPVQRRGVENH